MPQPELNESDITMMRIISELAKSSQTVVRIRDIRREWVRRTGKTDAWMYRTLKKLVERGLLIKENRGVYRPTEVTEEQRRGGLGRW